MTNNSQDELPRAGLPVRMIRPDFEDLPQFAFPDSYAVRAMRHDEGTLWERIWQETEPYDRIEPGLFKGQFGDDPEEIESRCFFLVAPDGALAGTISGWQSVLPDGQRYGQIHWVAIHPDHQGHGLAKPLMTHAMNVLASKHERCFLDTASRRLTAIKVYLDFGFAPDMSYPEAERAWSMVREGLDHPALG